MKTTTKRSLQALSLLGMLSLAACGTPSAPETEQKETSQQTETQETKEDDIALEGLEEAIGTSLDLKDYPDGVRITSGGTYTLQGDGTGPVVVEAENQDVILKCTSAAVRTQGLPCLYVRSAGSAELNFSGENSFVSSGTLQHEALDAALYAKDDLRMTGTGSAEIQSESGHGIKAKDDLDYTGGSVSVTAAADGIHINDTGTFSGGSLHLEQCGDEGIQSETDLLFSGTEITADSEGDALRAENDLQVSGGVLKLTTRNEGLESKNTLTISGGIVDIQAVDDGINAASSLTISGGTVTAVSSTNDGIDSNGDLILTGGTITASGTKAPEIAFDTDNTPFEISGGTIVGLGSQGQKPTKMDQNVLEINVSSLQTVKLEQNGTALLDWSAPEGMKGQSGVLTLSAAGMKAGSATLTINGSAQEVTLTEGLTEIGDISYMGGGGPGGQGGPGGMPPGQNGEAPDPSQRPEDFDPSQMPEDFDPGQRPEGFDPSAAPDGPRQKGSFQPGTKDEQDSTAGATPSSGSQSSQV